MNSHYTEELVAAKRQRRAGCCQGCRCAQKSLNPVRGQILTEGLHRERERWREKETMECGWSACLLQLGGTVLHVLAAAALLPPLPFFLMIFSIRSSSIMILLENTLILKFQIFYKYF
ncbi:hypothetical protein CHARACLAT_028672 [Characodon lateralis]|uniref:Uncharacterized protein n=1 Tax=Characodon lateralis TaxID=208331 RepID=A0ABU7DF10_9TELE|nr:hypothetical protein [Characodon lateralis]